MMDCPKLFFSAQNESNKGKDTKNSHNAAKAECCANEKA